MSQWETLLAEAGLGDFKADWRKWRFVEDVQLREALLLAFGLNPESDLFCCESPCFHDWWPCIQKKLATKSSQLAEQFGFIASLASRKFIEPERCDESHPHYSPEACKDGYIYYDAEITSRQFAEWVSPILVDMGLSLPPEFPNVEDNSAHTDDIKKELSKAYKLIALLVNAACEKKSVNKDSLSTSLAEKGIHGLGKTNINTIFSKANKELKE